MPIPEDFWTILGSVAAVLAPAAGAFAIGFGSGAGLTRRVLGSEMRKSMYHEVYAPLYGMFLNCHITTATGRGAPYFRQRWRNAMRKKRDGAKILVVIRTLFDKLEFSRSGGVEYGRSFPLLEINQHLKGREKYAGHRLLSLVARANRSLYEEENDNDLLTEDQLALFDYIWNMHQKLSKEFANA